MSDEAIRIEATGGPEVLQRVAVDPGRPGPGEVRVRHRAIGLNMIDTYHRSGLYPVALPSGLGVEAAGVVEAVGEGVRDVTPGQRVATFGPTLGAYATARCLPAADLFPVPDGISDELAAAALLKGCTTEFLVERCARPAPGAWVLVHAAAGGVGLLLVQWLRLLGARVIGTVGSDAKVDAARRAGCEAVLVADWATLAARVRELTGGLGASIVFDGVGRDSWEASLASTARRGTIVSYGNASGPVTGVALGTLATRGSLFLTRPTLYDYYRTPQERQAGAARLFERLAAGQVSVTIGQRVPLSAVADAHRALEARATIGATILLP